jgi:hypothetical protein
VLLAGTLKLELNDTSGISLWVDGKQINDPTAPISMDKGRHVLTFELDAKQRAVGLRVEVKAADRTVKFQPEGGL